MFQVGRHCAEGDFIFRVFGFAVRTMDRLSPLFEHYTPRARVFFAGPLKGASDIGGTASNDGCLHLLSRGQMRVLHDQRLWLTLEGPSLLFYPREQGHRLEPDARTAPVLTSARIELGDGMAHSVLDSIPDGLHLSVGDVPELAKVFDILHAESQGTRCGRQAVIDRIAEVALVMLFRHLLNTERMEAGLLTAMIDARLARVLTAMHQQPGHPWTLETLALKAGMSRTSFVRHFGQTVGSTPAAFLTRLRILKSKARLRRGETVKSVARSMGYASHAAFTRTFARIEGTSPSGWLLASRAQFPAAG